MNDVKVRKNKEHLRHTLPFSRKPKIWSFHVVGLQRTVKKCTKIQTTDLQTQHAGLSQFILNITLCNLPHFHIVRCPLGTSLSIRLFRVGEGPPPSPRTCKEGLILRLVWYALRILPTFAGILQEPVNQQHSMESRTLAQNSRKF